MASAATERWKNAERQWAKTLQKYNLDAKRITRAGNYSESTWDVSCDTLPWVKSDSKYSIRGWKENRLLSEVEDKYCKEKEDTAVLITKGYKERGQCATVDSQFLAMLLSYWAGTLSKEEAWEMYING